MRQKSPGSFKTFLKDKGFYIILILCITAIGISGYVLFFAGADEPERPLLAATPAPSTASQRPLQTAIPPAAQRENEVVMASEPPATPKPTPSLKPDVPTLAEGELSDILGSGKTDEPVSGTPEAPAVSASFFVWPLNGEVLHPFSIDQLVFNKTMGDWRVHTGADIAANLGTQVACIGDGVVEDVYQDELMGVTVVIDHGKERKSVYSNLMDGVTVAIGDTVKAGDVIGGVGASAEGESAESSHLHLEAIEAGKQIDPLSWLP